MPFPAQRMRRLRINRLLQNRLSETDLSARRLIMPFFVRPGRSQRVAIPSMPGQYQRSIDTLVDDVRRLERQGLESILLFGLPERKDDQGSEAWAARGIVQQAVRALKQACPDILIITDLCFCEYTTHGHCGVLKRSATNRRSGSSSKPAEVDNDATLRLIAKTAVAQAQAGADVVAPSGMMDGMVRTIRRALDDAGFESLPILSYAAKFASSFYGPFREAAGSTPAFGDRRGYQMNPANADEALREVALDIEEGADLVMVKPALAYLDLIRRIKDAFRVPVVAYNVSGEYSMVKAAVERGWLEELKIVRELLTGMRRAGADWIISYHTDQWLRAVPPTRRGER